MLLKADASQVEDPIRARCSGDGQPEFIETCSSFMLGTTSLTSLWQLAEYTVALGHFVPSCSYVRGLAYPLNDLRPVQW